MCKKSLFLCVITSNIFQCSILFLYRYFSWIFHEAICFLVLKTLIELVPPVHRHNESKKMKYKQKITFFFTMSWTFLGNLWNDDVETKRTRDAFSTKILQEITKYLNIILHTVERYLKTPFGNAHQLVVSRYNLYKSCEMIQLKVFSSTKYIS